jgi:hypothetical protein
LHELKSYEPAYLSGHKAQTYQIALDEGFERFKKIAEGMIYGDARRDIGGDEQRVHNISTDYSQHHVQTSAPADLCRRVSFQRQSFSDRRQRPHGRSPGRTSLQLAEDRLSDICDYRFDLADHDLGFGF